MAYLDQTVLLDYQQRDAVEMERFASMFGLRSAYMRETPKLPFLTPSLKALLNKVETRDVRIPAIKKDSITAASVMSYDIPLNLPETDYSTVTLVNLSVGYGMFPEDYENQQVDAATIEMNRIQECDEALAIALENLLDTHLDTWKTQVWNNADSDLGFVFDAATDTLQISKDAQFDDSMFAHIRTMADSNNWNMADDAILIANPLVGYVKNYINQLGAGNNKNLQFQVTPEMFLSNRVTNTAGMRWTGYMAESGSIGIVPNYTLPFRTREDRVPGSKYDISAAALPRLGDKVMLYEEYAKATSVNSNVSWRKMVGMFYNFFLLKKYNSSYTTQVANILKLDGKKV